MEKYPCYKCTMTFDVAEPRKSAERSICPNCHLHFWSIRRGDNVRVGVTPENVPSKATA